MLRKVLQHITAARRAAAVQQQFRYALALIPDQLLQLFLIILLHSLENSCLFPLL